MEPAQFGTRLKQLRERKGLTQQQLADKADITRVYVVQLETGTGKSPTLRTLESLAKALGVKASTLIK